MDGLISLQCPVSRLCELSEKRTTKKNERDAVKAIRQKNVR